jgi:hypothetical protein
VQYTTATAHNDTSGINFLPANNYDLAGEFGRADLDQRHRLVARVCDRVRQRRQGRRDGRAFSIGVDAFNVANRVNYSGFVGTITSPFFGRAIAAQPPRRVRLSAGFHF